CILADVRGDPRNKDVIYVANTCTLRSTHGGQRRTPITAAPGTGAYHTVWINPNNPNIILLHCDARATASVNDAQARASWHKDGEVTRYNRITGHVQLVGPVGNHRHLRTLPVLFSEVNPRTLYIGLESVMKTTDGGRNWETISPDLSRESYDVPGSVGSYGDAAKRQATRRGVVYSIGPSRLNVNTIWAGTDDGLIHMTRDGGKSWKNVTPPG